VSKAEAVKATRHGAIAGFIVAALTWAVTAYAIRNDVSSGALTLFNDSTNYFDAVFVLACAVGVYLKSRFAAIVLFIYYAGARIIIGVEGGSFAGALPSLIVLYFFGRAVYGSFIYNRIKRQENPDKKMSKWWLVPAAPVMAFFCFIIVYVVFSTVGVVPSTRVLAGSEIRDNEVALLKQENIISENATVTHFYSEGLFSILEGGNILTKERVISYYRDETGEFHVNDINLANISDVYLVAEGDSMNDSIYEVHSVDGDWLELYLSTELKGDELFAKILYASMAGKGQLGVGERVSAIQ